MTLEFFMRNFFLNFLLFSSELTQGTKRTDVMKYVAENIGFEYQRYFTNTILP